MKTPIYDFIRSYADGDNIRMHMPGHKGHGVLGESLDLTEISGADSLFEASGIIKESEEYASELFGAKTFYSTEGSSLSIRAMLYLTALYAKDMGKAPIIWAGRNAHKVFVSAAALIDFEIEWLAPIGTSYLEAPITAEYLERKFKEAITTPTAVYRTSPDYHGHTLDIKAISEICHKYGVLVLVDSAHGSYLRFLSESQFPTDLGADLAVSSAHKTLPTLTGGAYLHISKSAPSIFKERAKIAMSLFASTSPSYLILASLDRTNAYLDDGYSAKLTTFVDKLQNFKQKLSNIGYTICANEPMKITIATKPFGYLGFELAKLLSDNGVTSEFSDPDYIVLMPTPENTDYEFDKLLEIFKSIKKRPEIKGQAPLFTLPAPATTPRDAIFSPMETLPIRECIGRIAGTVTVGCPPAVPIAVSGEIISQELIAVFEYYGINELTVLK